MQDIENDMEESNEPLTKKKPRSEKQIEAFKNAMKKRADNIELKKQEKLIKASEILVQKARSEIQSPIPEVPEAKASPLQIPPPATPKPRATTIVQDAKYSRNIDANFQESESDEEIIIVKKSQPKKKKKVKKIIIEESDSESSDSGSDGGMATPQQQSYVQRAYPSHQQERVFNSSNYFI